MSIHAHIYDSTPLFPSVLKNKLGKNAFMYLGTALVYLGKKKNPNKQEHRIQTLSNPKARDEIPFSFLHSAIQAYVYFQILLCFQEMKKETSR